MVMAFKKQIRSDCHNTSIDAVTANFPSENRDSIITFDMKIFVLSLSSIKQLIISEAYMLLRLAYSDNAIYYYSK